MTAGSRTSRAPAATDDIVGARATPAQARGRIAEELAARHLEAQGLRILARNVRCRGGEVDLICMERGGIVFVEVRLRTNARFGGAGESITAAKQRRVLLAARWWLNGPGRRFQTAPCRFDAVLLDGLDDTRITWLRGAFDAG
ncbi:YraN family protein [Thauera butanivorans]|uniref:YraN family protein n=1 Tax=Thauera butanivorans TaxID=86174 RepID=UPI000838F153|nr:YraN family protein [Thauera butanivorans]